MAGSVAYSAFVSLLPLVLLSLLVASAVGGERIAALVLGLTGDYLTPTGQNLVIDSITRAADRVGLSALGVVVLLWGVLRVFRALDTAISTIYGTRRTDELIEQFRDGIVVLLSLGLALSGVVAVTLFFGAAPRVPFAVAVNQVLLVIGLIVTFVPVYYVFPDADVSLRETLPGAAVAAVGWVLLQTAFGLYVAYSSTAELYGVIGAVILLITWLYFGSLLLLVGAVTNAVLSGHLDAAEAGSPRPV